MKFNSLASIARCLDLHAEDIPIEGFSIDSREFKKGNLFFALKGEKFDGHDYLKQIGAKNGVAAVVDQDYKGESSGLVLLRVENVLKALQKLAKYIQAQRKQRIIAVTGSVGKTTTKEFIATLLSSKFSVAKTHGNNNSQVGLPLSILNQSGEEEFFVIEMGMTGEGQIKKLVEIAPPEIAVVTKIGHAHIGFFSDGLEGIARAKAEIFGEKTSIGVVNKNAMNYEAFKKVICPIKTFGENPAHYILEGLQVLEEQKNYSPAFRLPFSETQLRENFLAAVSTARILGLSWEEIGKSLKNLKPFEKRFERIERDGTLIINDCYNANPESVKAALENLPFPSMGGKTIAVLGEMADLGMHSEKWHHTIGTLAIKKVDHALCFGKETLPIIGAFQTVGKPAEFFHDLNSLKKALFDLIKPGDVVLIKGRNPNKLWQILE